jgi:replication factor C subunit 3/5
MENYLDDDFEDNLEICIDEPLIDENNESNESDEDIKRITCKKKEKKKTDTIQLYNETMEWMNQFKEGTTISIQKKENTTLPWVEKFRPKSLNDIISHPMIISTLKNFIVKKQFPHIILRGPPGTGKTSAIMACARELYGENYSMMVLDINASEERGIEVVRNKISDFISTKPIFLKKNDSVFKMVILDEADAMTADAQAMLVSVIEKFTINVRFCLICNYIKKISPAIQSRCTIFKFSPLKYDDIKLKLKKIASDSNLNLTDDGIQTIIKISHGDMRKVLNILQATSMAYNVINSKNVTTCIGYPTPQDMIAIYDLLTKSTYNKCYTDLNNIITKNGYSLLDVVNEITTIVMENFMSKKISQERMSTILINLRDLEMNLTLCPNDTIQLTSLVGLFILANHVK